MLLRRGLARGSPSIDGALAAAVLAGVVVNTTAGWWWADPVSAVVILAYGLREARDAWAEAALA